MKLWILRPIEGVEDWDPWYDKSFGHIVRAESEEEARGIVSGKSEVFDCDNDSFEGFYGDEGPDVWLSKDKTTCVELTANGGVEHIMVDFAQA